MSSFTIITTKYNGENDWVLWKFYPSPSDNGSEEWEVFMVQSQKSFGKHMASPLCLPPIAYMGDCIQQWALSSETIHTLANVFFWLHFPCDWKILSNYVYRTIHNLWVSCSSFFQKGKEYFHMLLLTLKYHFHLVELFILPVIQWAPVYINGCSVFKAGAQFFWVVYSFQMNPLIRMAGHV